MRELYKVSLHFLSRSYWVSVQIAKATLLGTLIRQTSQGLVMSGTLSRQASLSQVLQQPHLPLAQFRRKKPPNWLLGAPPIHLPLAGTLGLQASQQSCCGKPPGSCLWFFT